MLDKYIFNEDIKRVYKCIFNSQVITQYILKEFISDVKIINDNKKKEKEKIMESNSNNIINANNISKSNIRNDSSQNLMALNTAISKNSVNPTININKSFLYFNSSFRSLQDKLEGLIFECKWKKKYILLFKIIKINDSERFFKTIEIECIEMNHFENAFNIEISLFWNSSDYQTLALVKLITKNKIIEEILHRELTSEDKKIIYDNTCNYLYKDLSNIEHCSTSIIFANIKEISVFACDIKKIVELSQDTENKRIEIYNSPLISSWQNCRIYDMTNNKLCQEYFLSGYYMEKNKFSQIIWEKKVNNKNYCSYRLSFIYLEDNISLIIFRNKWLQHVSRLIISKLNNRKKILFEEIKNYFIKKNGFHRIFSKNVKDLKQIIGIKNYQKKEQNQIDLDMIIRNDTLKILDTKNDNEEDEYDSLFHNNSSINNSNYANKDGDNLFTDTLKNISEIENINSNIIFGMDETNDQL